MTSRQSSDRFLRGALQANKWIAGIAGVLVMLAAGPIVLAAGLGDMVGFDPGLALVFAVGIALLLFSGALSEVSSAAKIRRRGAMAALLTNVAWVVAGLLLLVAPLSLTTSGLGLVALLAGFAAINSAVQAYAIWARPGSLSGGPTS